MRVGRILNGNQSRLMLLIVLFSVNAPAVAPIKGGDATNIPASNYSNLRRNYEIYPTLTSFILWQPNKIQNFFGGGGNDLVGGSTRYDNLYGEAANDEGWNKDLRRAA
jgi:hypothetical protein